MGRFIDEVGNKHGRLLVIERTGSRGHEVLWRCRCDCGKESLVKGYALRKGYTTSCGCYQKESAKNHIRLVRGGSNRLEHGEAAFNRLYSLYMCQAKRRNIKWELSKEQFRYFTRQPCYYCGIKPGQHTGQAQNNGTYIFNGIDRLDSSKSYLLENCASCCKRCNYAKNDMTVDEFRIWIDRVNSFWATNAAQWEV